MRTKPTDLDLTDYAHGLGIEYAKPLQTNGKLNWRGKAIAWSYVIAVALIAGLAFYTVYGA